MKKHIMDVMALYNESADQLTTWKKTIAGIGNSCLPTKYKPRILLVQIGK
jgi:hypothetical protein